MLIGYSTNKQDKYFKELKNLIKTGKVKEKDLEQTLMGRFTKHEIHIIINRIDKSIKKELRKTA